MDRDIPKEAEMGECAVLQQTKAWLDSYFQGEIPRHMPLLAPKGTDFQKMVWQQLLAIGWGETRTYGEIAREISLVMGKQKMSPQAVGQAVGRNPIGILIPCHRVVGAGGKLTGYAWGLHKKVWLLQHERIEK